MPSALRDFAFRSGPVGLDAAVSREAAANSPAVITTMNRDGKVLTHQRNLPAAGEVRRQFHGTATFVVKLQAA